MTNTELLQSGAATLRAKAEALAAPLPSLLVAAERLASVVDLGVHGRRKAGMGETFWQFRRYGLGDPASAIDWRQSARTEHLFVREREWEAAEAVWFWRDGTAGMQFASDRKLDSKLDRSNLLALAIAILLIRGGERIALVGEDRTPMSGRAALERLAHRLSGSVQGEESLPADAPFGRHAQLIWLSDFLAPLSLLEPALRKIASGGVTGHLVHVVDPAEEDFPYTGRTRFEWPGGQQSEIIGRAERVRQSYRLRFQAQIETVRELARRIGWSFLSHRTDHRPESALVALYGALAGPRARTAGISSIGP